MLNESLDTICNRHTADKGSKWHDFMKRYEPHLEPLRDKEINLLEVGIQFGCSAGMWLEAFPKAQVYGVDIRQDHKLSDPRFHFEIGDQRSVEFWEKWKFTHPLMHVIIDDAEHRADASANMFYALWPHLVHGGLYSIEDVCTWFDPAFSSPLNGADWLRTLFGEVNWSGKSYGGKPGPAAPYQLSLLEATIDSIHLSKHLLLIRKK